MSRQCKHCNGQLNVKDNRVKYCSENCSELAHKTGMSEWQKVNRDRVRANARKSYYKNPDIKRNGQYKHFYGITLDQYNQMVIDQNGKCKICCKIPNRLHIDHNHDTGKVRGLLCNGCNRGIGYFSENIEALVMAAEYLRGQGEN